MLREDIRTLILPAVRKWTVFTPRSWGTVERVRRYKMQPLRRALAGNFSY